MPEKITADKLFDNLVDTIAEHVPKQKGVSFFEEDKGSVSAQFNRLFGRQKPVHQIFGGGKCKTILFMYLDL